MLQEKTSCLSLISTSFGSTFLAEKSKHLLPSLLHQDILQHIILECLFSFQYPVELCCVLHLVCSFPHKMF